MQGTRYLKDVYEAIHSGYIISQAVELEGYSQRHNFAQLICSFLGKALNLAYLAKIMKQLSHWALAFERNC